MDHFGIKEIRGLVSFLLFLQLGKNILGGPFPTSGSLVYGLNGNNMQLEANALQVFFFEMSEDSTLTSWWRD